MAGLSNAMEANILSMLLRGGDWGLIPRIWLSLHSADPADDGLNEISGGGYSRVEVTGVFLLKLSPGVVSNLTPIIFPTVTSPYTVSHWGLWQVSSSGDPTCFVLSGECITPITQAIGESPEFPAGSLIISID